MRYLKGNVSLRNRDYKLLRAGADARYMTHSQLFELARLHAVEFERPVFNWRVRRLVNSGLLRKQIVAYGALARAEHQAIVVHALRRPQSDVEWRAWRQCRDRPAQQTGAKTVNTAIRPIISLPETCSC